MFGLKEKLSLKIVKCVIIYGQYVYTVMIISMWLDII